MEGHAPLDRFLGGELDSRMLELCQLHVAVYFLDNAGVEYESGQFLLLPLTSEDCKTTDFTTITPRDGMCSSNVSG